MKRKMKLCSIAAALTLAAGCSGSPETPLSPSGAGDAAGLAASADGSTLKVTAPAAQSPANDATTGTRPAFAFGGSASANGVPNLPLVYRVQVLNEDGSVAKDFVGGGSPVIADSDLEAGKTFRWRVRAELDGAGGPWSNSHTIHTSANATTSGGSFGPQRGISLDEAFGIITRIHNELGYDLGSRSDRQSRIDFLFSAVAAIHYGHPRFNPNGGDPLWCVKDAGGGRPPSDDVLVRCDSREAWDLVGGAGGNGYRFHLDHIGRLPGGQNVYPPPASALGALNR